MLNQLRLWLQQAFRKSRTLKNEPLNKVSLVVLIINDLFILVNVFSGLDDIGQWYLSPEQRYPCYSQWQQFQQNQTGQKKYQVIADAIICPTIPLLIKLAISQARLIECLLKETDFSGANFQGADLSGAHLQWAQLTGTDLSGANLKGVEIPNSSLS